jgi:galactofuranose transport system permease protein
MNSTLVKRICLRFYHSKVFWPLVCLVALMIFNQILTPDFLSITIKDGHLYGSILDILNHATPLILISLGMTIVIATQGIDISVGSVIAISAAVSATVIVMGGNLFEAIVIALIAGVFCGAWNGMLVSILGIQPMIATLILYIVGRGIAQLITNGQILTFTNPSFIAIGTGYWFVPIAVYIAVAMILLVYYVLRKTALGLFVESIGVNAKASRFTGVKSRQIVFLLYVISGILASIAGLIICSNIKCADANNAGLWMELDAILATVIGGTSMSGGRFYLAGTVVGALFIQALTTTIYSLGVPTEITLVAKAIVVIVVCLVQTPAFRDMFAGKNSRAKKAVKV